MATEEKKEQGSIDLSKQDQEIPTLTREETHPFVQDLEVSSSFKLKDGRIVRIYEGEAGHSQRAQEFCHSNDFGQEWFTPHLMSQLVTIDNKALSPEEWKKMKLKVYNQIYPEFVGVNF